MRDAQIHEVVTLLRETVQGWQVPSVTRIAREKRDPYRVLISCLISLRTKDEVTHEASFRLFRLADTPRKMLRLSEEKIAEAIYPAGFYKTKSRTIREVSRGILKRFGGEVPHTIEDLLTFKGVGRKTANLVLTQGFGKAGICVDTHVHRITNRLGYVREATPDRTETALRGKLPREYWIEINDLLINFGKRICTPVSPRCGDCPIKRFCERVGVTRSR